MEYMFNFGEEKIEVRDASKLFIAVNYWIHILI